MSDEEEYTDEEVEGSEIEEVEPVAAAEPEQPAESAEVAQAEVGEEEEEEEEEQGDSAPPRRPSVAVPESQDVPKLRRAPKQEAEPQAAELTEAEQAMLAAKKRHEEEEAAKLLDYEQRRVLEKQQVQQELEELKQRQAERRKEREADEREFAARRKQDEERRRQDAENHKQRIEAEKAKREEEKNRRQNAMVGAFVGGSTPGTPGRNFVIQKKEGGQSAGKLTEGGKRRTKTQDEIQSEKTHYMSIVNRPVDVSNLLPNDLKAKIKQLHTKIVRLESEKYDLQKRHERQDYDLKELGERESQRARNKALALGVEVEQAESGKVRPPKINVASKFDRQVDRRSWGDKREQYENPFIKPPPSIARGTARPPPEWGRRNNEEIETLRKNLEPPKYVEQVKIEGARPPVEPKPLQLPAGDYEEAPGAEPVVQAPVEPEPPAKPKRGVRA